MANVYDPETDGSQKQRGSSPNGTGTSGPRASFSSGGSPRWGKGLGSNSTSATPSELKDDEEKGLYNPQGDKAGDSEGGASDNTGGFSNDKLKAKEESPNSSSDDSDDDGGLWSDSNNSRKTKATSRFSFSKKKAAIGGGIAGIVVGGSFLGFLSLAPLKVEGMIKMLEKYLNPSQSAMQTTADHMLEKYVVRHVLPDYKRCGTTLSSKCSVNLAGGGSNPVTAVYKDWADNRLEAKLASTYGIEFRYNTASRSWYLKAPGSATGAGDNIGANGERLEAVFQQADRAGMRSAFNKALDGETRWKSIHTRFQVGRLLEEKYGIKRCIVFCGTKDQLADFKDDKKNAAQIFLAQRVLQPRNASLAIAIECLTNGSCDAQSTEPTTPEEGSTGELEGTPENPDVEGEMRTKLTELAKTYGITDKDTVDKAIKYAQDISDKGYSKAALSNVLEKIGLEQITDHVADAAPIIGWVDRLSALISSASTMGPNLKKVSYLVGSGAGVSTFMMLRTYGDEVHTGHVDATEVGSMVSSLGPGKKVGNNDPVGGIAGAEASPLYHALAGGSDTSATQTSFLGLGGTASAATSPYKCDNGNSVSAGAIACSEEVLGQGLGAASAISGFLNAPGMNFISKAAGVIHSPFKVFNDFLGSLFGLIPGVNDLSKVVSGAVEPAFTWATNKLIPNPFGNGNLSGGRLFQIAGAGATVTAQDSCAQIGCQSVTPSVFAAAINQQVGEEKIAFSQESLKNKVFDRDSSYSVVSKVAMAMPSNPSASVANLFSNPFGGLFSGLGSVFYGAKASAGAANMPVSAANPFNAGTSAYPAGTIPTDPEKYWDDHNCGDTSDSGPVAQWQKAASDGPKDPDTGMPVHRTVEPCLLIKYTSGATGARYNTDNLTPDEQQVLNGGGGAASSVSSESSAGTLTSGKSKDLAQQLLPFISSGQIFCGMAAGGSQGADCPDIQNTAKGTSIGGNCQVDALSPHLLALILGLVKDDNWTVGFSSICSDHHVEANGPGGGHSSGTTADFSVQIKNGKRSAGTAAASNEAFINDVASLLSTTGGSFGQVGNCHPIYDSQKSKKFTTFGDVCNHQHIRAAP
jgi:hypothetical protein